MKRQTTKNKGGMQRKKTLSGKQKTTKPKATSAVFDISTAGLKAAATVGVLVLGVGVFLWWQFIFTDAERVFQDMLRNTLKTQSVTRTVEQEAGPQNLRQVSRLNLGSQAVVSGETTITQAGATSAQVTTEEIGTPQRDYVRYTTIETTERDAEGQEIDFSEVLGVWGASDAPTGQLQEGEGFSEIVLGILPFVYLNPEAQDDLYEFLQEEEVYDVDYIGVIETEHNGRLAYEYPVNLQPEPYVAYLKQLAERQGLTQLQDVNPADFRGVQPVRFTVTVDVLSRQPVFIQYGQDQRQEELSDFGLLENVAIPSIENTIPATELQQRLQNIQ